MVKWRAEHPGYGQRYNRRYQRVKRYGVTCQQWLGMLEEWDGLCASCLEEPAVHMDHDHKTGKNRAPLCSSCNQGLGNFKDDPTRLVKAIEYLALFETG